MSELPKEGDYVGGRYQVQSLLGEGGMGAVYAAINGATGRPVAIKWMKPEMAKSPEALARFLAEARTTARIEHPNVIQILDVGQDGDAPFLVMERLRGESLGERLTRDKRIAPAEAVDIIIAACNGVSEAHSEGIIHRDLKPDNIFLCQSKDGKPRAPKVLDFGISKLFDDGAAQQQQLTQTGAIMGTPLYMSPEQLDGRREPDARFDVYAMGVVLYETLSGAIPYNADTFFVLVQQIVAGNCTPLAQAAPWVPPELCAVVDRAMNPKRDERYTTMEELTAALEHIKRSIALSTSAPDEKQHPATGPMGVGSFGSPETGPMTGPVSTETPAATHVPVATPGMVPTGSAPNSTPWVIVGVLGTLLFLGLFIGVGYFAYSRSQVVDGPIAPGAPSNPALPGTPHAPVVPGTPTPPPAANAPQIGLTFTGTCAPRFDVGRLMVMSQQGVVSIVASSTTINGSLNIKLPGPGDHILNTRNMENGVIVQVMVDTMWLNIAQEPGPVYEGTGPDPISGVIHARHFDAAAATLDLTFEQVVLQNNQDGSLCMVNGTLRTSGTVMPSY